MSAAVLLAVNPGGRSELHTTTDQPAAIDATERIWVIPRFMDEPRQAIDISHETVDTSFVTSLVSARDPDQRILLFRQEHGVYEDSGTPIDINGTPGYLRASELSSPFIVDIEWQVDGMWQVVQAVSVAETDVIEVARRFEAGGIDALTTREWDLLPRPDPQEVVTIIGDLGILVFQDYGGPPLGGKIVAESNGFTVYRVPGDDLIVEYQGRLILVLGACGPRTDHDDHSVRSGRRPRSRDRTGMEGLALDLVGPRVVARRELDPDRVQREVAADWATPASKMKPS